MLEDLSFPNNKLLIQSNSPNSSFYIKALLYAKKQELREKLDTISKNKFENNLTMSTSESFLNLKIEQIDRLIEYINYGNLDFGKTDFSAS